MNRAKHPQPGFPVRPEASITVFNDEEAVRMLMAGIVNSAMDAILTVDNEQNIVLFNAAAEQMFLCPASDAVGSRLDRFIPERFRDAHSKHIQRFGRSKVTNRRMGELGVIQGLRANGDEFPIEASISQIEVEGQKFFTVILRDVTKRKFSEQQLAEQAALLNIARDAIVVRDMDDRVRYWSAGAVRIYGYTEEEAVGKIKTELLYPDGSAEYKQAWTSLLEQGFWNGELRKKAKDGREIIAECRWTLVRDAKGEPQTVLSVNSDVTEKRENEAKFLRAQRLESIGILAGGIAHDLNNVLAPILLAIGGLERETVAKKSKRKLEIIRRNAKLGAEIIAQLLSFARGRSEERIALKPDERVREICTLMKRSLPRSISFKIETGDDVWGIFADVTQFNQMLMNLCVNARDAMPEGGSISILVENEVIDETYARMRTDAHPGRFVRIAIEDTGVGIAPDVKEKIFEPFFTTKEVGEGTGLGLATVLGIVKSHGGFIDVYSEPGRGTTFRVHLPAADAADSERSEISLSELPAGHGEMIVVADDEATFREITRDTLESFNYQVLTASDGTEVVTHFLQYGDLIKAVLLDMSMPYMDGPATIIALEKINPQTRVIATSGFLSAGGKAPGNSKIVKAFLAKPCTAEKLLRTLSDVVGANGRT